MANFIVSYEKSTDDVPVLVVARENVPLFSVGGSLNIVKTFTGDEAVTLFNKLTSKEDK